MTENLIDGNSPLSQTEVDTTTTTPETQLAANPESNIDEYLDAPKSYKKEYNDSFKSIPFELRKYIHQRENEMEEGKRKYQEKLDGYKWLDDAYAANQARLSQSGVSSPRQWFDQMSILEQGLSLKPKETLKILASEFGIPLADNATTSPDNALDNRLKQMENSLNTLQQAFAFKTINSFAQATDNAGNLIHPHFEAVKNVMGSLLSSGIAKDEQDAYDKAVWLVPDVKKLMLSAEAENSLKNKAAEAQKAKEAGFDPKGKPNTSEERELSTREFLEREFAKHDL